MLARIQKEKLKRLLSPAAVAHYHTCRLALIGAYRQAYSLFYRGSGYYCPFCGQSHRRFLPDGSRAKVIKRYNVIGGGYRTNCLCPACGSKDRERLLYAFLQQYPLLKDNRQADNLFLGASELFVLHIAPEKNLKKVLQKTPNLTYINADLDAGAADIRMDITQISYPDNYFDVILCSHVLEHIPNDIMAMRELYRVLKPQGVAILQVPFAEKLTRTYEDFNIISPADREIYFGQFDHVRIYGQDYLHRLRSVGFVPTVYEASDFLKQDTIDLQQLIANEKVFLCQKQTFLSAV